MPGSLLPDVPAVEATVSALGRTLVELCGLRPEHLRSLTDPEDPLVLGTALTEVAGDATDVLLLYYVGHGLVSSGNELYLATQATDDLVTGLSYKALPYQAVRDVLSECRARSVVVVLDCCFAGRARGAFGTAATHAFELASLGGTYVLASASADEQALAPVGAQYTAFTGELLSFLREGVPAGPPDLTVEDAYRHLRRALPGQGMPEPHRHLSDRAGELVLARNPAAAPPRVPGREPGPEQEGPEPPCPYRGLRSFTADDAAYYFGREKLVGEVLRKMSEWSDNGGPVAVVGPSGAGKSSLLHAGLVPAIRRGELRVTGSETWPHMSLTPGEHPLTTLARRLAHDAGMPEEALAARLREHPGELSALVRKALGRGDGDDGRLLVLVDQFEELFTQCADEGERRAFIEALCSVSGPDGSRPAAAMVVVAVRADFYSRCLAYPELAPTFRQYQVPVVPMTPDELRDAIERPAAVAGYRLEEGLSGLVLRDLRVGGDRQEPTESGFLPLLSYALEQTWVHRDGRDLLIRRYEASGGVWNAVTREADLVYEGLDPGGRRAARLLLLRMVHVGSDFEDTRRRVDLTELAEGRPEAEAAHIAAASDALTDARLITVDGRTAQIAHEALVRSWPRLRGWIDEDRRGLLIHRQLTVAAREWDSTHDRTVLYGGPRLAEAREWFAAPGHRAELTPSEQRFLARSVRSRRLRRAAVVAGIGVLVAALLSGLIAVRQSQVAADRADAIASRQLALLADSLRDGDPATALDLSLAAYDISPTSEAGASVLHSYVTAAPVTLNGLKERVFNVAYSGGGHVLAAAAKDRTVRLWDVSDPNRPVTRGVIHTDGLAAIAYRPGGKTLAVQTERSLTLWDVTDPAHPVSTAHRTSPAIRPPAIAFSPDGSLLAVADAHGVVHLWDTASTARPTRLPQVTAGAADVHAVAFAPKGRTLAVGTAATGRGRGTSRVTLWALDGHGRTGKAPTATLRADSVESLAFNPQGTLLAAGGVLGAMAVWDTTRIDRPAARSVEEFSEDGRAAILSISFKPDGKAFLAADATGTVEQWEVSGDAGPPDTRRIDVYTSYPTRLPVYAVAYSPDGSTFVSGGDQGSVGLWTTATPPALPGDVDTEGSDTPGTAFSPDGRLLAVSALTGPPDRTQIWNVKDPHHPVVSYSFPQEWASAHFIGDGRTLITQNRDRSKVALWDVHDPRQPRQESHFAVVGNATVSNDGRTLAVGASDRPLVAVYDITDPGRPRPGHGITVQDNRRFSQLYTHLLNNHWLLVWDDTGANLWDIGRIATPQHLFKFDEPSNIGGLAYNDKTHLLAMWDIQGSLFMWNLTDPRHWKPTSRGGISAKVQSAAFIDKDTLAVSTSNDSSIALWNVGDTAAEPQRIGVVTGDGKLSSFSLSPDRRTLAEQPASGQAHIWDVGNPAHPSDQGALPDPYANAGEFSPDGRTLAMTSNRLPGGGEGIWLTDYKAENAYRYLCSLGPHPIKPKTWDQVVGRIHPYRQPCGG
ncbi:caspase family protein [Streptomyces sp. NPDC047022]|uniref:caspase, EACC1-associated type n=1 Tax=Streptomyces sp. NPDC047022 TaxID=3155737 RepID=UPI0034059F57